MGTSAVPASGARAVMNPLQSKRSQVADTRVHAAHEITFLLIPRFSMMAFCAALEPLRSANRMSGKTLYTWNVVSVDGEPVQASNGLEIGVTHKIADVDHCTMLLVCSGINAQSFRDRSVMAWLRKIARTGATIGSLCTGAHLLAEAGLLSGYRCTIHWEDIEDFTEKHPELDVTGDIFEIDRSRITCSGGTAALDLMLHLITLHHGVSLAGKVSEQFIHERIRESHDQQRMKLQSRVGTRNPKVLAAIRIMETNIEEPERVESIAEAVGISRRQLERLFETYLNQSPSAYYRALRLQHARLLLLHDSHSIISAALASGFNSASHFSQCYREHFNRQPREEKRFAA